MYIVPHIMNLLRKPVTKYLGEMNLSPSALKVRGCCVAGARRCCRLVCKPGDAAGLSFPTSPRAAAVFVLDRGAVCRRLRTRR